ncbi:hypothetical protein SAMN05216207_104711 [Pseudonocardia ammonioxydans]|uniref:Uncharacterized protein n=1 Tax=Pseudonocardia ammonioxydans TaxID=260086 RepID=A0A1I5GIJ5_PSUAM|nr:hypothetical protein [Pseudonocardia ammonioxydans]SFO35815.1 hypothetical protein SAMN05216207_104711 [Pseudonocardia ammonioxydans]
MSDDLDYLMQLVARYDEVRAELLDHPSYEAGCAPDRLLHARDDSAIEVADAVERLLPRLAPIGATSVAHAVAWFRQESERMRDLDDVDNRSAAIAILRHVTL